MHMDTNIFENLLNPVILVFIRQLSLSLLSYEYPFARVSIILFSEVGRKHPFLGLIHIVELQHIIPGISTGVRHWLKTLKDPRTSGSQILIAPPKIS